MSDALPLFLVYSAALITSGIFIYGALRLMKEKNSRDHEIPVAVGTKTPQELKNSNASVIAARLTAVMRGDISIDAAERAQYSHDTSIFVRMPSVVVYPKDADDVAALVKEVASLKREGFDVSVTARAAGTCMSGGPLTFSIVAVFTKYLNHIEAIGEGVAIAEPGVYYRDFEKATRAHGNQILPSFPASRELCALGGIVNNNSGGERTLEYGKTSKYVQELHVVLADGTQTTFGPVTRPQWIAKKQFPGLEGSIYRSMDSLLTEHAELIEKSRPTVSKNSAGYALWDVHDKKTDTFNLAKLITGAQGTLALTTSMKLGLVTEQGYRSMLVVFLHDLMNLPDIVREVLAFNPESFESFDEHTLSLAIRFLPQMLIQMGIGKAIRLGLSFLPEVGMAMTGGLPKLILMAEFSEDTHEAALAAAAAAGNALTQFHVQCEVLANEQASEKYWIIRRESFALLRKHSNGLTAAAFIDDLVVPPSSYPEFLPKLDALLRPYHDRFIYTIAGHIGNGNFHIIPLMDLSKPEVRAVIPELSPKVYDLVMQYGGSTTGEHNDGIIRTPYLPQLFGGDMYALFEKTKHIFDPQNILNPGKKVGGTFSDIEHDMIRT